MNSVGSIWQKWDLHIHTPASFKWDQGKKLREQNPAEREQTCKDIVARINATDVAAFCIMDYWTFDGYQLLRQYLDAHPDATTKKIFPGIELRMEAPTDFRLNTHVLISDEVPLENLQHFLSTLRMGGPDGKPPSRQNLIDVARQYDAGKCRVHGFTPEDKADDDKMYHLGVITVEVSRESVKKAIDVVGIDHCLLIQPYGCSDGIERLDWEQHPYADHVLMKWADCFETRKQSQVDLFLGVAKPARPNIATEFLDNIGGHPKPVVSGSDAHDYSKYGVYPSDRVTWFKAQPTFKGLRQVCHEPALRCHIGGRPPKLDHVAQNSTKYMKSLALAKVAGSTLEEHWFDGIALDLNPGLVAIIGNKGSGKSALADILALAGNSHCTKMEFLNDTRFRRTGNKAKHFTATLTWTDDNPVTVPLDHNSDLREPERVRYLPQHFIEELCNEISSGNQTSFEKELKKVIFSHVPPEKQLKMGSLDELLDYLIQARKQAFAQVQQELRTLNETITRNEGETSDDTLKSYRTALLLKEKELEAIDKAPLTPVAKPPEDPDDEATKATILSITAMTNELNAIQKQLAEAKVERVELVAKQSSLVRLGGYLDNFENSYKSFLDNHAEEFIDNGFEPTEIAKLAINRAPIVSQTTAIASRLVELTALIEGKQATDSDPQSDGLVTQEVAYLLAISKLQDGLKAPEKAHQDYLKLLAEWNARRNAVIGTAEKPDTIEYYKDRLKRATEVIPNELTTLREERRGLVRRLHAELLAIRNAYEESYSAVQSIAEEAANSTDSIQLEFDAYLSSSGFEDNFLDFIHKNRKGNFYGDDDGRKKVREIVNAHDFNSTESVLQFTDAIMMALTETDKEKEPLPIPPQLRDKKRVNELYDYIFGLGYLDARYTLRLGKKDISQLSPGEKGALLLVFYLLLDKEEIPIIIDQPEHNLDNESVVRLLVDCIRKARSRRQVVIVTHNPNLAVYCDADQIIYCHIDKLNGHRISYETGAIEDYDINTLTVNVLEGTYRAFDNRRKKYHKPIPEFRPPGSENATLSAT